MDEYLLEGLFPGNTVTKRQQTTRPHELTAAVAARAGNLKVIDSIPELYEWMNGPVMQHFVCDDLPLKSPIGDKPRQGCYLPDGSFVSDNLIEIRTLRVLPRTDEGRHLRYFTQSSRSVEVSGSPAVWGGKWKNESARDAGPTWEIAPSLTLNYEAPEYRFCPGVRDGGGDADDCDKHIKVFKRIGWYDRYEFGGFRAILNGTRDEARETLRLLQESDFIDRYTRATTISTVLANPPLGLWAYVSVLVETPEEVPAAN